MDWSSRRNDLVQRSVAALHRYVTSPAADSVFLDDMQQRIDAALSSSRRPPTLHATRMRILLLGYCGAGNSGADLRTIETIRQLRQIFPATAEITLFALGDCFDHPVLAATPKLVSGLPYLPDVLDAAVSQADLVLNVEGSTYTSKFSDSLAGVLIGGVALAAAHGRAAVAYGVDSGYMSAPLRRFASRNAAFGTVICRNRAACDDLLPLGIAAQAGTDTAWTYKSTLEDRPQAIFRGNKRAALCPNNPYWWPVHADAIRARALDASGEVSPVRYGPFHFHSWDETRAVAYKSYLERLARIAIGLRALGYTPVLVGMEKLDRAACSDLAALLPFPVETVARGAHTLDEVIGSVRDAQCVVTTRYHAAVLAMAHNVPVFGLSMDQRIDRLLIEAGVGEWFASCDEPSGDRRALEALASLGEMNVRDRLCGKLQYFANSQRALFWSMGESLKNDFS